MSFTSLYANFSCACLKVSLCDMFPILLECITFSHKTKREELHHGKIHGIFSWKLVQHLAILAFRITKRHHTEDPNRASWRITSWVKVNMVPSFSTMRRHFRSDSLWSQASSGSYFPSAHAEGSAPPNQFAIFYMECTLCYEIFQFINTHRPKSTMFIVIRHLWKLYVYSEVGNLASPC